jgi:hypothetical protein
LQKQIAKTKQIAKPERGPARRYAVPWGFCKTRFAKAIEAEFFRLTGPSLATFNFQTNRPIKAVLWFNLATQKTSRIAGPGWQTP